jgi:hypothetical protein
VAALAARAGASKERVEAILRRSAEQAGAITHPSTSALLDGRGGFVRNRRTKKLLSSRALLIVLAVTPACLVGWEGQLSKNLHCERYELARSQEICRALEREMEWTWMGHAIIAPGWRVTWGSLRRVFCTLHIDSRDTLALARIVVWYAKGERNDDRVEFGSSALLYLLGKNALEALPDPESMPDEESKMRLRHLRRDLVGKVSNKGFIYHPSNPQYILRDGCPR